MPRHLHLVDPDSPPVAGAVIAAQAAEPDARVTVALLAGAAAPALPSGVAVVAVSPDDAGHAALLDLIFASDHVTAW